MAAPLTKRKLLKVFPTARALAKACNVDESWVSRWPMDASIPRIQDYALRIDIMPERRRSGDTSINWTEWDKLVANGKKVTAYALPVNRGSGMRQSPAYVIRASYGNDSCALIQFAHEHGLQNVAVLYSDTGWSAAWWNERVADKERWVASLGFTPARTSSIGLEALVRARKGWPRQGLQFCTQELKLLPGNAWLDANDPDRKAVVLIGKRREESKNRANEPEWKRVADDPQLLRDTWQPLVALNEAERDALLERAGIAPLPHRSMECYPCINSNRADLRVLASDEETISKIERIETEMGTNSKGNPRTMFRPYRYMGATGIREIIRWAKADRGEFESLDDGNGKAGCDSGLCGD